jgi:hypothetical protein
MTAERQGGDGDAEGEFGDALVRSLGDEAKQHRRIAGRDDASNGFRKIRKRAWTWLLCMGLFSRFLFDGH